MRILKVFPRRTKATPDDGIVGTPGLWHEGDAVHISVTFTWDLKYAEWLARAWRHVAPVTMGGPATGQRGDVFTPGMYVKEGYTITSRGCPNRCWFCSVWKRDGDTRELPIHPGWNLLDDNILATSETHCRNVFAMLKDQKSKGKVVEFTGGLEAARLKDWHVHELRLLSPKQMFFAYDTPDDYEPLFVAGRKLRDAGWTNNTMRCYVLIGYPKDTMAQAEKRLRQSLKAGFMPMAMLWRDRHGDVSEEWKKFQRLWARPAIVRARESANIAI